MEVLERDWKMLKKKLPRWQEKFMEGLVEEYKEILNSEKLASEKFWELEKRLKQDKKLRGVLVRDLRRSNMHLTIGTLIMEGAITMADLDEFSDELKEKLKLSLRID